MGAGQAEEKRPPKETKIDILSYYVSSFLDFIQSLIKRYGTMKSILRDLAIVILDSSIAGTLDARKGTR